MSRIILSALFLFVMATVSLRAENPDSSLPETSLSRGEYTLALIPPIGNRSEAKQIARTALRRIPEIQGIPYRFIEKPEELADYRAAVLAKAPSNAELTSEWTNALYSFVEHGGVLLSPGLPGSDLYSLLGIRKVRSNHQRERIIFEADSSTADDPILAYIDHPNERAISIGNGHDPVYDEVIWSHGASTGPMAEVLGRFDDGSAALVRNYYGRGIAYYLGTGFAETVLLPQTGGDFEAQRKFVNSVEPSADTIMLLLKALYEANVPVPVYLSPIPQGRPTALILTHDVDAQTSFVDSLKFARLAEQFNAKSTFFINTKYFEDRMDIAYYSVPENLEAVQALHRRGHEIASHTVSHALEFDQAPVGSSSVTYTGYRPKKQISINGEVRVSKQLLEQDIFAADNQSGAGNQRNPALGTKTVDSFRAGYLAYPTELIGVLESAGYRYDSSFSANDILTTFPYFAFQERRPGAEESSVIEIPLTLDDALGFLTEETKEQAVRTWKEIVRAHAANETITVLLIHPSDTRNKTYKLEAQRELMEYARKLGAWMGSIGEFGDFWRARHQVRISGISKTEGSAAGNSSSLSIRLNLPAKEIHRWTALVLPASFQQSSAPETGYNTIRVLDADGRRLPHSTRSTRSTRAPGSPGTTGSGADKIFIRLQHTGSVQEQ